MGLLGHVPREGNRRDAYTVLVRRPEKKSHVQEVGVDGKIILICVLKKLDGETWTELIWLRIGTGGGLL